MLTGRNFVCACFFVAAASDLPVALAQQPTLDPDAMFQQLDANQDGKLTIGEGGPGSQQFIRRLFEMANKKEADSISRDELRQIAERHRRGSTGGANTGNNPPPMSLPGDEPRRPVSDTERSELLPGVLRALDVNRDGRLSRSELNRLTERFNDWDRNRDGQLEAEELRRIDEESSPPKPNDEPPSDSSRRPPTSIPGNRNGNNSLSGSNGRRPMSTGSTPTASGPSNAALQARLTGTWRGWVVDGRGENPNAGHMQMELRVEGNRMIGREVGTNRAPEGLGDGTFVVSGTGNSGSLDAVQTSGQHMGREYPGIFELDGDTLRWCVNNRNGSRPAAFESNRGNYYMILRRQGRSS